MSETLTPNNSSAVHPIKLKFGTFVEPIHTNMPAPSGIAVSGIARALWGAKLTVNGQEKTGLVRSAESQISQTRKQIFKMGVQNFSYTE